MDAMQVEQFLAANAKNLPTEKIAILKDRMLAADDSKLLMINSIDLKDTTTMLLISIFLGGIGVDRFMFGDTGMGVLKLLTAGVCSVLWIIDIVNSGKNTKEYNFNKLMAVL